MNSTIKKMVLLTGAALFCQPSIADTRQGIINSFAAGRTYVVQFYRNALGYRANDKVMFSYSRTQAQLNLTSLGTREDILKPSGCRSVAMPYGEVLAGKLMAGPSPITVGWEVISNAKMACAAVDGVCVGKIYPINPTSVRSMKDVLTAALYSGQTILLSQFGVLPGTLANFTGVFAAKYDRALGQMMVWPAPIPGHAYAYPSSALETANKVSIWGAIFGINDSGLLEMTPSIPSFIIDGILLED